MKVLLLIHRLSHGGAQRQLIELARGLKVRGHEVSVVTFYPGGELESDLRATGVELFDLGKRGRWEIVRFFVRAARRVRAARPDVIYSFLIAPNLLSVLLRLAVPDARIVWGVRASDMDLSRYDRFARVAFRAGCVLSGLPHRVIVNSSAGMDHHVAQGYPSESMVVVPNGIDTERYRPDRSMGREVRAELGVSHESTVVGLVGRLDPMKDHSTFLEAAVHFSRARPESRFVCVGDGPDPFRRSLLEQTDKLDLEDRVIWAGARDDMPAVYNALDLVTSSSVFGEGFPNVIGEAMACGVPCVVTDVGDSARVVGDADRVVPPGDPRRLSEAWLATLDEGESTPSMRLRERIEREYSTDAMTVRTERELRDVADGHPARAEG